MTDTTLDDAEARALQHEAATFESDREYQNNRSRAIAWRIALIAVLLAAGLGVALIVVVLRFEPVAFMVAVDRATGESSVMKRLGTQVIEPNEAHDKHNLKRFVEAREGYFYSFLQRDYNLVTDMGCEPVAQEYAKQFEGERSLDKLWRDGTEVRVQVTSVRLLPDQRGRAVVAFDRIVRVKATGDIRAPEHYTATLAYDYRPDLHKPESTWIENPTGFRVCAYRKDIDLSPEAK